MYYNRLRIIWMVAPVALAFGCSTTDSTNSLREPIGEIAKAEFPRWSYYVTITPEQIKSAQFATECTPAENDSAGNWGTAWQGLQLSIRLQKEVFTNGEPVVACITLRNIGETVKFFSVGPFPEEKDTKVTLLLDGRRILGWGDPKPGESFAERVGHVRAGSAPGPLPISPGTQRQFFRDLSKMFDLSVPGSYSARAERLVVTLDRVPGRPGYLRGLATNLLSGTVTFRVVEK